MGAQNVLPDIGAHDLGDEPPSARPDGARGAQGKVQRKKKDQGKGEEKANIDDIRIKSMYILIDTGQLMSMHG